ncbi:type II toxin-antitoxin system HicA family toxin [Candidatus Uhrbacteria bacterium]|nr:type II toxin-antitoxin system HicA family toxin [Candidatus Uhrbacteria bacterium]
MQRLRSLGFTGPFTATRHEYMMRGDQKIFIPNPHGGDIGTPLLKQILKEFDNGLEEWIRLEK